MGWNMLVIQPVLHRHDRPCYRKRLMSRGLTTFLVLVGLSACSVDLPLYLNWDAGLRDGDEGRGDATVDASAVDGDPSAPRVLSTNPGPDATGVEPSIALSASFSVDMDPATIDANSFVVTRDGVPLSGAVTYDVGARTATFVPDGRLSLLQPYQAKISTEAASLTGTAMANDHTWVFKIREGLWGTPTLIETDDAGNAAAPRVATDGAGNAIAVWYQSNGSQTNIRANRYAPDTGWSTATPIETNATADPTYPDPQVAVSPDGNAIAVWFESDGTRTNIWANRYVIGVGWGTAALIETDNTDSASRPEVAVDSAGNAFAVWQQSDGTRTNIWANRYVAGSGWASAVLIETENLQGAVSADVDIDANGNAIAVWSQANASVRFSIWANRYVAGSGWGIATKIETDDTGNASSPRVGFDSDGNAIAVWQQHDGTRFNILANRYETASGWGTATLIETGDGTAQAADIAVDRHGNAFAIWRQSDGTQDNLWVARYAVGSGWGTPEVIETDNGIVASGELAFDGADNAVAVWFQSDGTRNNIWANRYVNGSGWGAAGLIESRQRRTRK